MHLLCKEFCYTVVTRCSIMCRVASGMRSICLHWITLERLWQISPNSSRSSGSGLHRSNKAIGFCGVQLLCLLLLMRVKNVVGSYIRQGKAWLCVYCVNHAFLQADETAVGGGSPTDVGVCLARTHNSSSWLPWLRSPFTLQLSWQAGREVSIASSRLCW